MAGSTSRLSYQDCFELYDKALAAAKGIRHRAGSKDAAMHLKSRLHYARSIDRKDNREVYDEGEPLYGRSAYDPITIRLRQHGGAWWLYLLRVDKIEYHTENIGEDDGDTEGTSSDNGKTEGEKEDPPAKAAQKEERRA